MELGLLCPFPLKTFIGQLVVFHGFVIHNYYLLYKTFYTSKNRLKLKVVPHWDSHWTIETKRTCQWINNKPSRTTIFIAGRCSPQLQRLGIQVPSGLGCSFQIRPVTLSFSSFLSPPEKNSAMFLWMMRPS